MSRLAFALILFVAAALSPRPSTAAELPIKAPPPIAGYRWSGFYAGGNFGGGWSNADWTNVENGQVLGGFGDSVPPDFFATKLSGTVFGGQIGFNYQSGALVLGVEALGDWAHLKGDHTSTFGAADDQFAGQIKGLVLLTGRVGYAWNNLLVYGKGGYGTAYVSLTVNDAVGPTTGSGADHKWLGGPTVGIGLEYGLTSDLSVGVEYDYLRLGTGTYELGDATGSYRWDVIARNVSLLMAKVNYRIQWSR